jgi:DNA polymerase elongation subunit (family B)
MIKQTWTSAQVTFVLKLYRKNVTRAEISKLFNRKFDCDRTSSSIKHCIDTYGAYIEKDVPKVLILDIETRSLEVKTFGLRDQNISLNQVVSDGGVLCWSAKWLGEKEVFYKDFKGSKKKEKELLKPLWKLMDEADIVLGQNSKSFDVKILVGKFMEHEMGLPSGFKQLDTLVISRRNCKFMSHKLEYMSNKFCKVRKLIHSKFPGFALWHQCELGNRKAWVEMEKYNKNDVLATEDLFVRLSEYDRTELTTDAMRAYHAAKKAKK